MDWKKIMGWLSDDEYHPNDWIVMIIFMLPFFGIFGLAVWLICR